MSGSLLTGPIPSFTKRVTGYRAAPIRTGDTPERIALRELGDASLWYDIVNLNDLRPPWIVDDPALAGPGVLLSAQDTILIPSTAPAATGVAESPNVFGRDALLVNGQLAGDGAGDIAVVADVANLKQALENRLGTRPGELVYHGNYGCRAYTLLGRGATALSDQLAAAWVGAACRADPRVSSTTGMVASTVGDVLSVTGDAIAVNGKRIPVGLTGATP
jgi:phage baseplate assembly protein W